MIVTTTETVPGKKISKVLGVVDIEIEDWTTDGSKNGFTILGGAKAAPGSLLKKLRNEARRLGADAIVGLKRVEIYYGTAVKAELFSEKPKKI